MEYSAKAVQWALESALDPWIHHHPLLGLIRDFALAPFLLVFGGQDADVAQVWCNGEWQCVQYHRPDDYEDEDWHGALTNGVELTTVSALHDGVLRKYRWNPSDPSVLHVDEDRALKKIACTDAPDSIGECPSYVSVPRSDGAMYLSHRLTVDVSHTGVPPTYRGMDGRQMLEENTFTLVCPRTSTVTVLPHAPVSLGTSGRVCVGLDLYLFHERMQSHCYRASLGCWTVLPSSGVDRSYIQPCLDEKRRHIYLVGSHLPCAQSCQRWLVDEEMWQTMPRMNQYRWGASLVMCDSRLIAIGGRHPMRRNPVEVHANAEYLALPCNPVDAAIQADTSDSADSVTADSVTAGSVTADSGSDSAGSVTVGSVTAAATGTWVMMPPMKFAVEDTLTLVGCAM